MVYAIMYYMTEEDVWEILSQAPRMLPDYMYTGYEMESQNANCDIPPPPEEDLPEVTIYNCSTSTVPCRRLAKDENSET